MLSGVRGIYLRLESHAACVCVLGYLSALDSVRRSCTNGDVTFVSTQNVCARKHTKHPRTRERTTHTRASRLMGGYISEQQVIYE